MHIAPVFLFAQAILELIRTPVADHCIVNFDDQPCLIGQFVEVATIESETA